MLLIVIPILQPIECDGSVYVNHKCACFCKFTFFGGDRILFQYLASNKADAEFVCGSQAFLL